MADKIKSGSFLDLDIELTIRSSKTDLKALENIIKSLEDYFNTLELPVVLVELETKLSAKSEKKLLVLKRIYQSKE